MTRSDFLGHKTLLLELYVKSFLKKDRTELNDLADKNLLLFKKELRKFLEVTPINYQACGTIGRKKKIKSNSQKIGSGFREQFRVGRGPSQAVS